MAVDRCSRCNASLGTLTQDVLPGTDVPLLCAHCERAAMAGHYLKMLPEEDEEEWDCLNEWEQEFVTSVREQYADGGNVSEKQFAVLTRIYEKLR